MLDQLQSQVNSTETASGMRFRGFLTYLILYLCLVASFKHMFFIIYFSYYQNPVRYRTVLVFSKNVSNPWKFFRSRTFWWKRISGGISFVPHWVVSLRERKAPCGPKSNLALVSWGSRKKYWARKTITKNQKYP